MKKFFAGLVPADGIDEVLRAPHIRATAVVGGTPLQCADIRALVRQAQEADELLAVDARGLGAGALAGVPALRLGAAAAIFDTGKNDPLVLVSTQDEVQASEFAVLQARATKLLAEEYEERLAEARSLWKAVSGNARALAAYLSCHPAVATVSWPGRKDNPSFEVAARTLEGGFGPLLDWQLRGQSGWQRLTAQVHNGAAQVEELEAALAKCRKDS